MASSLGFHTLSLQRRIACGCRDALLRDFMNYSRSTGCIKMYSDKYQNEVIKFYQNDHGIEWKITRPIYNKWEEEPYVSVIVTINPKILGGVYDYITAANLCDMEKAIERFNSISSEISIYLAEFDSYTLRRIDYCVNFDISELGPDVSYRQVLTLIKRSDIPSCFTELVKYDPISHRMKSPSGSFYLTCLSTHINCYSKYMQLLERSKENEEKGYPPISLHTLSAAKNIIRFEVQCKYAKTKQLAKKAQINGNLLKNKSQSLLSYNVCFSIIEYYYRKIVRNSSWRTLADAIQNIQSNGFNQQKEDRLINALRIVNQCRSVSKAKALYTGHELETFKRSLKDLEDMGINPVTIPKEWGIKYIGSPLLKYERSVSHNCKMEDCRKEQPINPLDLPAYGWSSE